MSQKEEAATHKWKQQHVKVGVGALIFRKDPDSNDVKVMPKILGLDVAPRVLLGKRKGSHGAGKYALPGGHLELGESINQCASREVKVVAKSNDMLRLCHRLTDKFNSTQSSEWNFAFMSNDVMVTDLKHYITIFVVHWFDDTLEPKQEVKNMEPQKCEKWDWCLFKDLKEGKKIKPEQFFVPMRNLLFNSNYEPVAEKDGNSSRLAYMGV